MPWVELAQTAVLTAFVALAMVALLWLISIPLRDISIIDMAFSALIAALVLWLTTVLVAAAPSLPLRYCWFFSGRRA